MTFYIDIIFVENIIMNYIILFATGLIIKKDTKHLKLFVSSIIGATYAIMSYISRLEIYTNQITKFLLSIVMIYIAYNPNNIKKMFKDIVIFYLTSFCFGSVIFSGLISLLNDSNSDKKSISFSIIYFNLIAI